MRSPPRKNTAGKPSPAIASERGRVAFCGSSGAAKQIGQAQVGPGFNEMFPGIGHTIVEGAKFSGESIKEFFAGKK